MYEFDLEYFLTSAWFKELKEEGLRDLEEGIKGLEEDLVQIQKEVAKLKASKKSLKDLN